MLLREKTEEKVERSITLLEEEKTNGSTTARKNLHISRAAHKGAGKKGRPQRTSSSKRFDQYATYPIVYSLYVGMSYA